MAYRKVNPHPCGGGVVIGASCLWVMAIRAGTEVPVEAGRREARQSRIREFVEGCRDPREVAGPSLPANKKPRHPSEVYPFSR